ncbi:Hypothetical protein R9X50_00260900 [Acrodontium crateriforme]|uniref:YMC020W-like alpha/beta hydrolase domain-containing protein n=1 Tax=Acrodontium crateriforme TaxID=150365 RepID=A0AAQ3R8N8_9PEZI|nr:Hypothetical protein R9X50_00260900 [Acrodontium crateriforme]
MSPAEKKSKPNDLPQRDQRYASHPQQGLDTTPVKPNRQSTDPPTPTSPKTKHGSWYNGGPWRAKASAVAEVARESVSVDRGTTSEASEAAARRPSQSVIKGGKGSRKSVPLIAEPTMVHATSEAGDKARQMPQEQAENGSMPDGLQNVPDLALEEAPLPPQGQSSLNADVKSDISGRSGKWLGWWSRPDGYSTDEDKVQEINAKRKFDANEATRTPLSGTPAVSPADVNQNNQADAGLDAKQDPTRPDGNRPTSIPNDVSNLDPRHSSTKSWFGIWSKAQNQHANIDTAKEEDPQLATPNSDPPEDASDQQVIAHNDTNKPQEETTKSSGWAFWTTDKAKDLPQTPSGTQRQIGELAVADTPSQSHPEVAQFNQESEDSKLAKSDSKKAGLLLGPKRGRDEKSKAGDQVALPNATTATPAVSQIPTPLDTPPRGESTAPMHVQRGKQVRPNLILPSFHDVYPQSSNPTYLERLAQYLAQTLRIPGSLPPPPPRHVHLTSSKIKIRRAIAIGVHGFFPAPLLQKVLGQPTGTSIRFANYAAESIKNWCLEKQPEIKDVEIEKVALEGEGFIADRVTTLWKLLLNWLSHLRQADFILVACHSQGVPVALTLVAKLIQLGCLNQHVRVGVCAMAGINLGPFPEYKSRLFSGTALELFDFCDSRSKVSKTYAESLDICLRHGVRLTFIGSIDDQLVSLESSLHAPLSHPYVARAVFIDGRLHTPNFLTHLVVFALKMRNLGVSDHGLIRELSGPLAGSLVGGEGHSRVYDDPAVYSLAVTFALESTDMLPSSFAAALAAPTAAGSLLASDPARARQAAHARRASLSGYPPTAAAANSIRRGSISASTNLPGIAPVIAAYDSPTTTNTPANPFYLPWAVRGMLEEDFVRNDVRLSMEVEELVKEFEEWKPSSKVLKDVKWRLEGVRSML